MASPSAPLTTAARAILAQRPDVSDVEFALAFLPDNGVDAKLVGNASNDRLTKVARMILSLVREEDSRGHVLEQNAVETSLVRLVKEFNLVVSGQLGQVPRVPFGKTGLKMPIATLGCMRFQQVRSMHACMHACMNRRDIRT